VSVKVITHCLVRKKHKVKHSCLLVVVDDIAKGVLFLLISHTQSLLIDLCCLCCGIGILLPQLWQ